MHIKKILSEIQKRKPRLFTLTELDCWEEIKKETEKKERQKVGKDFKALVEQENIQGVRVAKPSDSTTRKIREDGTDASNRKVYVYEKP